MEGSKSISITIKPSDISGEIMEHAYYIGEGLKSDNQLLELGAKIQASSDEGSVIKDFLKSGASKVASIFTSYVGKTTYTYPTGQDSDLDISYTIAAPGNISDSEGKNLKAAAKTYLSEYVIMHWLNLIKPDEAVRFATLMKNVEEDIRKIGLQRTKPTRA